MGPGADDNEMIGSNILNIVNILKTMGPGADDNGMIWINVKEFWTFSRADILEERRICKTKLIKSCEPKTVTDCMQVSELRCEVGEYIF